MKLSVIMPCYNEEATLRDIVEKVQEIDIPKELILVDDGSKDRTREIIKELARKYDNLRYVFHEVNQGKGMAFRTGLAEARGELVIIQDADLEYDPRDYYNIVKQFEDPKVQVVYGSRLLKKNNRQNWSFFLGGIIVTLTTNILFFAALTDEPTCYKTFRREFVQTIPLNSKKFDLEPELTAKILKRGVKIWEVPISYYPRSVAEGKKIRWSDGTDALWTLLKYRFID